MAKKEMLISVCDRCDKQVMTETASIKKNEVYLPVGWVVVSMRSRTVDLLNLDLCNECSVPVLNAMGEHRGA
jgi:hypothetical protein